MESAAAQGRHRWRAEVKRGRIGDEMNGNDIKSDEIGWNGIFSTKFMLS